MWGLLYMQALHMLEHNTRLADAWCCGSILCMPLAEAFPFLTAREARLPPMQQLPALVQRIVIGQFLDLMRSVSLDPICKQTNCPYIPRRRISRVRRAP